jgi:hypothetical protein
MKVTSIVAAIALASSTQAWYLHFYSDTQKVITHGTERNECNNLKSSYNTKTRDIYFYPKTDNYPDPTGYTAYSKADCKGTKYFGASGWQSPDKKGDGTRFRSYKVTSN